MKCFSAVDTYWVAVLARGVVDVCEGLFPDRRDYLFAVMGMSGLEGGLRAYARCSVRHSGRCFEPDRNEGPRNGAHLAGAQDALALARLGGAMVCAMVEGSFDVSDGDAVFHEWFTQATRGFEALERAAAALPADRRRIVLPYDLHSGLERAPVAADDLRELTPSPLWTRVLREREERRPSAQGLAGARGGL